MLNRIIKFSLNNRLSILIAAVVLMVIGIYTAKNAEVDVFPDLNAPTVVVMTEANGMAPEEVERIVTFPIETAVNGATNVRRVRSSSTTGFSIVQVEFDWGTDIYRARQIVTEKLSAIGESLPKSVGKPTLGPQSSILGEMMIIGLTIDEGNESLSMLDVREIADWIIRPRLLSISGVANVAVMGGDEKEYQVLLHPEKLRHHSVSVQEILDAVQEMNQNVSGGTLYEYGNEYLIRGVLSTKDVAELGQTVVKSVNGVPVLLNQLADVEVGAKTPKTGVASNNAKTAVLLTVTKQPNVSTERLTAKLDAALDDIQKTIPQGIAIDREIFRQQRFIDASISNIQEALIEGAFFVVIVLFIFLMNWRTTVISLVTIPLALLVSIIVLHLMGMTLNTMSIGGMAIAIGSLVDDAIVDVENVYKRIRQAAAKAQDEGKLKTKQLIDIVFHASREVRMPILNSTLIIVVSFLPLFFLSGMEGRMLVPLGIAFILSLFASTIVALTLTPVLCSFLLKNVGNSTEPERPKNDPKLVTWLKARYETALTWALVHRRPVLGSAIGLFLVAIVLFFTFGRTFLPPFNEGSLTISISTLPGIALDESDKIGRQAEELLMQVPEIKTVARKTGRAELDEHAFGVNTSEIEAPFELGKRNRDEFMDEVRDKLKVLPGVSIEIGQPISHRIDAMLSGTQANIAIKIFGNDLNKLYTLGNQVKSTIAGIEGVTDLNVEQQVERPQLRIAPRRSMMAKYGVTPSQFADYVHVLLEGEAVSTVYEGNNAFDLTVKVASHDRDAIQSIRSMMVDANGQKIPFEYIADIESSVGPNTINRENVQRRIVVSCNVSGRDLSSTVSDIRNRISADVALPEGYHVEYGGQFESEESASRILMLISCISIVLIYLLLYAQFKNIHQAGVVLLNLPLALIGGVFAIAMTGGVVSIPSIIGFISLFGIATRNGILLIDKYNENWHQQTDHRYIIDSSLDRLTPILMTALTSALALIPLALGGDLPGNEIQSPMAKVLLGGLISSTLLNMFITPLVYKPTTDKQQSI
ncbi:MAG: efflux RND transporter permease subunit [Bacteroidales bacterium]|nr:efflux RND transporter permease subunit [Bacteroidales bacterium]